MSHWLGSECVCIERIRYTLAGCAATLILITLTENCNNVLIET